MKRPLGVVVCGTIGVLGLVSAIAAAVDSATGPSVTPAAIAGKAGTPPPAGAKMTNVAGKGQVKVSTANSATDKDSVWVEQIDIDANGNAEDTTLVWDDEDKVLYGYAADTLSCRNRGTAEAEVLVATFAAGNPKKRPAGSGFWVAELDKGECAMQAAGLWGCTFDAHGNDTACGAAVLDERNDDLTIVTATR